MILNNGFIYNYVNHLEDFMRDTADIRFPAKVNYIIQKNYHTLNAIAIEIMRAQVEIYETYNTRKENGRYFFETDESLAAANKELQDLQSIEQEVNLLTFSIEDIDKYDFTMSQMDLLMLMIKGEE